MSTMKRAKSSSVDPEPKWLTKARELGNVLPADRPKRAAPVDVDEPLPSREELAERGTRVELALAEDAEIPPGVRERAARTLIELATRGQIGGNDLPELTDAEIAARLSQIRERLRVAEAGGASETPEAPKGEEKP